MLILELALLAQLANNQVARSVSITKCRRLEIPSNSRATDLCSYRLETFKPGKSHYKRINIMAADTATYTYDNLGRLKTVTYTNGTVITYNYDVAGNRTSIVTSCPSGTC
ncbi:MAG: hypothetical protein QG574_4221 [Cyanobacteriota bacterium erpe_2018_sw_21hr_WHONDRS-SW48-000092_B_bin.40]|jgi:YD repeat-containing protein|nr:hypothetical protein [Cyanobacteriota bacterium erpe_2018_sw_21hr_WHONDRS-SW48-000092_B_bin.40]